MARQKCVMSAMLQQLDPQTVVSNFGDIASAGKQVISTSIPSTDLATFVNLAMKTRQLPVATVSFVPPQINTADPDWARITSMVSTAIAKSEAKDDGAPPGARPAAKQRGANDSGDLASSC
jgi:anionic cell wall polymer biosynthesis LytR-Cps2A-Psr (LCP) family protein